MPNIDLSILNQRQTPAFYASSLATRPAFGFAGRIFIDTDSPSTGLYRDTGAAWVQIADPGAGTTGTLQQVTTNGNTTSQGISITAGGLNANNISLVQNTGTVKTSSFSQIMAANDIWEIYGIGTAAGLGQGEMIFSLGDDGAPYASGGERFRFTYDTNIVSGSVKDVFIVDYDLSYFNTSLGINTDTPTAAFDVHSGVNVIAQLNQTVATNNSLLAFQNNNAGLWRIGNFYNAGANDWGIFDVIGAIQPVTVKKTTGQVLIGTSTVGSGRLVVANTNGDSHIQIVGATAPSIRIDSAEIGPTKRAGLGISTSTNNFIQGSADRDFCMFNGSTTASPILFGVYDAGAGNVQEAARISAARNFLIGTTTDSGEKLQVTGSGRLKLSADRNLAFKFDTQNTISSQSDSGAPESLRIYADTFRVFTATTAVGLAERLQISNTGTSTFRTTSSGASVIIRHFDGTNNPGLFIETNESTKYVTLTASGSSPAGQLLQLGAVGNAGTLNISASNVLIGTTTDNGNKLQVNGNISISALSTLHVESQNVTTSSTQVSEGGIGVGAFYFAAWFNNIGGAQGVATLMARGSTVVIVSISDGSGAAVAFTASSGTLFAQTTVGSVTMAVTQIKL